MRGMAPPVRSRSERRRAYSAEYVRRGWWSDESVLDRYAETVRRRPGHLAVVDAAGRLLTHEALWAASGVRADELAAAGAGARDVVLVHLPNVAEWQVAYLACLRLGAVPATLPVTTDEDTLAYIVGCVRPRAVVGLDGVRTVRRADDPARCAAPAGVDHLMFTSSTTGRPKAVAHSERTLGAVNAAFTERFGLGETDSIFMPSPLGHSVGAWHGSRLALWNGAPLVLQDRWDPQVATGLLAEHGCVFTAAATPFLTDLVHAGAHSFGALRTFLCGGAPVPPSLVAAAEAASPGTLFSVLWGMTEGGVTTCTPASPPDKRATTAGLPLPGLELRVLTADGVGAVGEEGELVMRGPGVCVGYAGQEDLFEEQLTDDGFFRTGDLAVLDADGYVRVTGRLKDLVIRGGVNVSPLPTEDALAAHPHVRSVAVIGVPDDRLGERIGAVVVTDGASLELDGVCRWLADRGLPKRQWPERLFTVDAMPRTPAGKIRKNVLRETLTGADA